VAANLLVDAGWDVLVLEAQPEPGGAVRTAEVTAPGFRNDPFSAFYPLAACSSVLAGLDLEGHGLEWTHSPRWWPIRCWTGDCRPPPPARGHRGLIGAVRGG
jgi:phytoene dehydrogenase-like protein